MLLRPVWRGELLTLKEGAAPLEGGGAAPALAGRVRRENYLMVWSRPGYGWYGLERMDKWVSIHTYLICMGGKTAISIHTYKF